MELLKGLGILLLVVTVAFAPLFGLYYIIRQAAGFFDRSIYGRKVDLRYAEELLSSKFPYYRKLDSGGRARFMRRLIRFIDNKDFIGSGGLQITDEMVILISASSIQLTFGLKEFKLNHFSKIFVYPKAFYSKISKQYHKGETNLAGAIALSWSHFQDGYNKPDDKMNLGLHEMAHALRFDKFKSDEYDRFFDLYYSKWHVVAQEEFRRTRDKTSSFFREYGGTNFNEFFAVCVESFFESPAEFRRLYPEIYKHMSILLNQDPMEIPGSNAPRDQYRKLSTDDFEPKGKVFYKTGISIKNVLALIFAAGIWTFLSWSVGSGGYTSDEILLMVLMLIVGYYIAGNGFSRIIFYENGILVKPLLPQVIRRCNKFSYAEVVCVEFEQNGIDEYNDLLRIIYLEKGKIRKRDFTDNFSHQEIAQFADYLVAKKVAVKLSPFAKYAKEI